jgi:hypothetical protein
VKPEWDMHFLTSLIIVAGFAFVICLGLVRMISDLSQLSFHESPVIRETPSKLTAAEDAPAKAVESRKSSPTELIDTR